MVNDWCCIHFPRTPFHLPHVAHFSQTSHLFLHSLGATSLDTANQAVFQKCLCGNTHLVSCSSLSAKISLHFFLTFDCYPSFLVNLILNFYPVVLTTPHSLLVVPSSLLIFKSHMLPARLAQLHPDNERLFIGLRLSAAKQGLATGLRLPHPPLLTAQSSPHACSGLALSPRRRLLVSAALN